MKKLFHKLFHEDSGLILSAELVLVLTIAVLGVVVGLAQVQTAVVTELQDISLAFSGMNQSFGTPGFFGCRKWWGRTAFTAGSGFIDFYDGCIGNGGGGVVGANFNSGIGGGGYGGGYAEIGSGYTSSAVSAPQVTTQPANPCETCTPGTVSPTPLPEPQGVPNHQAIPPVPEPDPFLPRN